MKVELRKKARAFADFNIGDTFTYANVRHERDSTPSVFMKLDNGLSVLLSSGQVVDMHEAYERGKAELAPIDAKVVVE